MTDGASGGANGWPLSAAERQALSFGWLLTVAVAAAIVGMNVMTRQHDFPQEPLIVSALLEGSSALSLAVAFVIPAGMALWLRRARPRPFLAIAVQPPAAIAFSALHVAGFVLLRTATLPAYRFGPFGEEALYEFGKDALTYGAVVAGVWGLARSRVQPPQAEIPEPFDIREGARLVRTPVADILAVRAAANYAEFILRDGRRPLMRTSLGALEAELGPRGFVRTHRSCLVNARQVTGLRPAGSGDYTIELGSVEAPLSRRYRNALETLRA